MFLILICCNNNLVLLDHCSHGVIISQSQGRSPREGLHKVTCQLYSNPFVFICNSHKQINIHRDGQKYDRGFIIRVLFSAKQTICCLLCQGLYLPWSPVGMIRMSYIKTIKKYCVYTTKTDEGTLSADIEHLYPFI